MLGYSLVKLAETPHDKLNVDEFSVRDLDTDLTDLEENFAEYNTTYGSEYLRTILSTLRAVLGVWTQVLYYKGSREAELASHLIPRVTRLYTQVAAV